MTVNKLQLPAKQNAVQLKINEIIDNLGGGGATDVQINGTSITSNNVANILTNSAYGTNNKIATMNDLPSDKVFVATYGTTTYQEVLDAYNAGKTIKLITSKTISSVTYNINTFLCYFSDNAFYFYALYSDFPRYINLFKIDSNDTWTKPIDNYGLPIYSITGTTTFTGDANTPIYITENGYFRSTGWSIASSRFDGQWTQKYLSVASGVSAINTYSYSISSYLPDSTNAYEVYLQLYVNDNTTSGTNAYTQLANVSSPNSNISTARWFCQITSDSSSALQHICTVVNFKANERTIYAQISGRKLQTGFDILLFGYRRIGTNT